MMKLSSDLSFTGFSFRYGRLVSRKRSFCQPSTNMLTRRSSFGNCRSNCKPGWQMSSIIDSQALSLRYLFQVFARRLISRRTYLRKVGRRFADIGNAPVEVGSLVIRFHDNGLVVIVYGLVVLAAICISYAAVQIGLGKAGIQREG